MTGRLLDFGRTALPLVGLLVAWEVLVRVTGVRAYILPTPLQVIERMGEAFDLLVASSLYSLTAILVGFVVAVVSGFVLAILIAYSRWLQRIFEPLIVVLQVVPKVALAPLFLIWFGHGLAPKIIIVATIAFFPVLVNTILGLKSAEGDVIELMESVAASKAQIFWKIRLPTALPFFFPALKMAALLSVIGAMVGEFVASDKGLGHLMILANVNLETDLLFAALVVVTGIGLVLYGFLGWLEQAVLQRFGDGGSRQLVPL
jgi:NitT/TauT family transport system permease protein